MTWRNKLQQASFRGIKFFIDSHDYAIGRRTAVHQYPFQDEAYVEDLGQEADQFSIDGYILQKPPLYNYFRDRDKLIKALKEPGPGILVHRYLGEKRVALVGTASVSERFDEGGVARFRMTFVEAGKNKYPLQVVDPKKAMDFNALDAIDRALDAFGDAYDTAQSVVDDITGSMAMIKSTLRTLKNVPATIISAATKLVTDATSLISETLNSPCDLASSISGAFNSFTYAAGMLSSTVDRAVTGNCSGRVQNPSDATRQTDQLSYDEGKTIAEGAASLSTFGAIIGEETVNPDYGGGLVKIAVSSPDSAAKQANRQANINMVRLIGLAQACRIAVRVDYKSREEADGLLLSISQQLDTFIDYLGDQAGDSSLAAQGIAFSNDEVYQSAKGLKPVFEKAMNSIGASLANKLDYEVGVDAMSSIQLAYDMYGDVSREDEIIERNKGLIFHPGFLPNGKTIDILSK